MPQFTRDFQPPLFWILPSSGNNFAYRAITFFRSTFQEIQLSFAEVIEVLNTTSPLTHISGFSLVFAHFTRRYLWASQLISFPAPTWMFPSGAFPLLSELHSLLVRARNSNSAITGSKSACDYPVHFAASHGLHRRSSLSIPQLPFACRNLLWRSRFHLKKCGLLRQKDVL